MNTSPLLPNDQRIIDQLDPEVLEVFLRLLRDKYRLADTANFHLEHRENVSGISIAITNQRDVTSHFITILRTPGLTKEKQLEQISNAEEHLRRAIIEPYEQLVNARVSILLENLILYKEKVLPRATEPGFSSCPSLRQIENTVVAINKLRDSGRSRKSKNIWDADWEEGVKAFVEAYELARELCLKIDESLILVRQVEFGEESLDLSRQSLAAASVTHTGIRHLNKSHIWIAIVVGLAVLGLDLFLRWILKTSH